MSGQAAVSVTNLPPEELVGLALEAISDRSPDRLRPLLHPEIRVTNDRGATYAGPDGALEWAGKRYDHLDRRFVLVAVEPLGDGLLGAGRVEYVWREGGEVGDSAPAYFGFQLRDGLLIALSLHDTEQQARAALLG